MKKIMEKNKYIQPEISICHVETDQMMAYAAVLPVSTVLQMSTSMC